MSLGWGFPCGVRVILRKTLAMKIPTGGVPVRSLPWGVGVSPQRSLHGGVGFPTENPEMRIPLYSGRGGEGGPVCREGLTGGARRGPGSPPVSRRAPGGAVSAAPGAGAGAGRPAAPHGACL